MTDLSEGLRALTCSNLHSVPAGCAFCPFCGQPVSKSVLTPPDEEAQVGTAQPIFGVRLPAGPPWLLGPPRFNEFTLSLAALVLIIATSLLAYYVGGPQPLWNAVLVVGLALIVLRTNPLGLLGILGLTVAAIMAIALSTLLLFPALAGVLGDWDQVIWPGPWAVVAAFGRVYLAVGLSALLSPRMRDDVNTFLRPRPPMIDVPRFCFMASLAFLGLLAGLGAFTEWGSLTGSHSESQGQELQQGGQPAIIPADGDAAKISACARFDTLKAQLSDLADEKLNNSPLMARENMALDRQAATLRRELNIERKVCGR